MFVERILFFLSFFKKLYFYQKISVLKISKPNKTTWILIAIAFLLSLPAFFIHLGLMPFTSDEPTRGIVALEMMFSGNYIIPTIKGEFYYNKPPLYNWILIVFYKLLGVSEFSTRLPAVFSLYGFAFSIFYFFKKYIKKTEAALIALMFLSCGRILFWDSMLGLIDIFYSWTCFLCFMWLLDGALRDKWWKAFLLSYSFAAIGVLMKGLPSILFQGISVFVLLAATKKLKKLFSIPHILGVFSFLSLIAAYFYFYQQHNSLDVYFTTLWAESSSRTPLEHNALRSILHFLKFHPDMLFHFAPWTLLSIAFFHKKFFLFLKEKKTILLLFFLFVANLIVYWISPSTIPRYLIMLIPLSFLIFYYYYKKAKENQLIHSKIIDFIFSYISVFALLGMLWFIRIHSTVKIDIMSISLISGISLLFLYLLFFKKSIFEGIHSFLFVVILLFIVRIFFNLYFLPDKTAKMWETKQKSMVEEIHSITKGKELLILHNSNVDHTAIMYFEMLRQETLRIEHGEVKTNNYYIATKEVLDNVKKQNREIKMVYEFFMIDQWRPLYVFTLKNT